MKFIGYRRLAVMGGAFITLLILAYLRVESSYPLSLGTLVTAYFVADGYAKSKQQVQEK